MSMDTQPQARTHAYPIRFTASGSEYFRIWIVNMLLILVTMGIYLPWAKVRKLQYFYSNTLLDGHALDFHGDPLKMLRGTLVAGAFLIAYSIAGNVSGLAALLAALAFVCIWPLMVRASLRFRLANTSWRGLRLAFTGDVKGVYGCVMPPLALVLVPIALASLLGEPAPRGRGTVLPDGVQTGIGAAILLAVVSAPWFLWRLKRYQHDHYACGSLVTQLRSGPGPFYGVALRTLGIVLLGVGIAVGLAAVAGFLAIRPRPGTLVLMGLAAFLAGVLFFNIVPKAYAQARLQNLLWSRTGNTQLRFRSALDFQSYALLQFKNFMLILVTLGFYWPFAAVANMRARLEAVTLHTRIELEELAGSAAAGQAEATGDAAADLFGLDLGF